MSQSLSNRPETGQEFNLKLENILLGIASGAILLAIVWMFVSPQAPQPTFTEDFNVANRDVLIDDCWTFSSTSIKSSGKETIDEGTVRTGQLTNSVGAHKVGTPCTKFTGTGRISFDHKITSMAGNVYKRLDVVAIANDTKVIVEDTILTMLYPNNQLRRDTIDYALNGEYTLEWRWTGQGGIGRALMDNLEIEGERLAFGSGGCSCIFGSFPVEWLYFNAESNERNVRLTWATAQEQNNDYFTLERMGDRTEFEELGKIEAVGNSSSPSNYAFSDEAPFSGRNLYRLKQTDIDGAFSYSSIVEVYVDQVLEKQLTLAPNPVYAGREAMVMIEGVEPGQVSWQLMSVNGQVVQRGQMEILRDRHAFGIKTNRLVPGAYIFHLKTEAELLSRQLIVR